jgi:hypothetical protein
MKINRRAFASYYVDNWFRLTQYAQHDGRSADHWLKNSVKSLVVKIFMKGLGFAGRKASELISFSLSERKRE